MSNRKAGSMVLSEQDKKKASKPFNFRDVFFMKWVQGKQNVHHDWLSSECRNVPKHISAQPAWRISWEVFFVLD